jgi:DNA repair exonuclease SbcCD ATPase subunit
MVTQLPSTRADLDITWEPLPADFVLPDDPVENIQQPFLAAALTDALDASDRLPVEALVASNFALVATVKQRTVVKAPDWLYVPKVNPVPEGTIRRSYTPYREGSTVAVVMEFLSDEDGSEYSSRRTYPLFLGRWYGLHVGRTEHWLRWWDRDGNLVPWNSEKAEQQATRAEQAAARAEQEAARAEQESARAEQAAARAEQEAARSEQEAARAEQEAARAEQEAARAEQEAARAEVAEAELIRLRALLQQQPPLS